MKNKSWLLLLILLQGVALRIYLANQGFWLDEAADQWLSHFPPREFLGYLGGGSHPPLYYFLMHFWQGFGRSEVWLRLPSILAGLGTIWLVFLLGKKFVSQRVGLLAALFLAVNPYHIYFSQEARMYSLATLFSLAAIYSFLRLLEDRSGKWAALNGLFLAASFWTEYFTVFLIPAQAAVLLAKKSERLVWKLYFLSAGAASFTLVPWLPTLLTQIQGNRLVAELLPDWQKIAVLSLLKAPPLTFVKFVFGNISFVNKFFYGAIAAMAGIFYASLFWLGRKQKDFLLLFFIPLGVAFLLSFVVALIQPWRFLYLLPIFLVIAASGIDALRSPIRNLALTAILLISLASLFYFYANPRFHREDWRRAVQLIEGEARENSVALFAFPEPFAPYQWYSTGYPPGIGALPYLGRGDPGVIEAKARETITQANQVFYFHYLAEVTDPTDLIVASLKKESLVEGRTIDFRGVGFVTLYLRND